MTAEEVGFCNNGLDFSMAVSFLNCTPRYLHVCIVSFDVDICCPTHYIILLVLSILERDLLDSLPFSDQCSADEEQLLRFLYENKLKKVRSYMRGIE